MCKTSRYNHIILILTAYLLIFARGLEAQDTGSRGILSLERERSQIKIHLDLNKSAQWSLFDSQGVKCSGGLIKAGTQTMILPKVASSEDILFSLESGGEPFLSNQIFTKGSKTPSKLPKLSHSVRIYQLSPRTYLATGRGEKNQGHLEYLTTEKLENIKKFGVDYLWVTGVIEHASPGNSDRDVVKGEAGSYFAIRDAWDIQENLGGLSAFEDFLDRAHRVGLRVLVDLVPNHTARIHKTDVSGKCGMDFGFGDQVGQFFSLKNTYYYLNGQTFVPPIQENVYGVDGVFDTDLFREGTQWEYPAKATGNDIFSANPGVNDWFETAKLNYGWNYAEQRGYFSPTPSTWTKVLDVANYWLNKGVDGFRVDFAHSVPIEFWRYFGQKIKSEFPNAFLIAEAYESDLNMRLPGFSYEAILQAGFDSVYSSEAYWKMRAVAQKQISMKDTGLPMSSLAFFPAMLSNGFLVTHYMENHDEVRLASRFFSQEGGEREKSMLGWAMTSYLGLLPGNLLIHGGQEFMEGAAIFGNYAGDVGKTSIFDYIYQDRVLNWFNGRASRDQIQVYEKYRRLMELKGQSPFNLSHTSRQKTFINLMSVNANKTQAQWVSAYVRFDRGDRYLIVTNTDPANDHEVTLHFTARMNEDSHGILAELGIISNEARWRFRDILDDLNWEPQDPAIDGSGIPGWILYRSEGIPSGLYLGKLPRSTTRVLKMSTL